MDDQNEKDNSRVWRRCNSCKKPISFGEKYWICNVSTCNRKRTGLVFCDVSCWDAHVPMMNHRDSWAEEKMLPSREVWAKIQMEEEKKQSRKPKVALEVNERVSQPAQNGISSLPPKVILRRKSES